MEPIGIDHTRFVSTLNKGINLAKAGQLEVAVKILAELAEQFDEAASVHTYLGGFLLELNRYAEAVEQTRRAVSLAPGSEKASLGHFHALWKSGERIEALEEMKRFLMRGESEIYSNLIKEWDLDGADA